MLAERIKLAVAALIAVAGIVVYYTVLADRALVIRVVALLGSFAVAAAVMRSDSASRSGARGS